MSCFCSLIVAKSDFCTAIPLLQGFIILISFFHRIHRVRGVSKEHRIYIDILYIGCCPAFW